MLATGAALAVIMLAVGVVASGSPSADTSEGLGLNRAIVRGMDLIAAGGFLAYFSALRVRRREQLSKLADWPGPDPSHMSSPSLATVLSHCAPRSAAGAGSLGGSGRAFRQCHRVER